MENRMSSRCLVIQVVACATTEEARREYLAADPRADLVELRLDGIRDLDPDRLLGAAGKPKLITIRSRQQGGAAPAAARAALLRRALEARVEYLDLEMEDQDLPFLRRTGSTRVVLSFHDLVATPIDLPALYARLRAARPGALVKIVTFAEVPSDILRVRDLLRAAEPGSLIALCAGAKGVPSRILAPLWGSAALFAPRRGGTPSAPGQVSLEDLFEVYRADAITPDTRLLGILGHPLAHSLSPRVHNAALTALGLNTRYLPFEAATLAEFLPLLSEMRIHGLSVTLPHKERIFAQLDMVEPLAAKIGAVNTVTVRKDGSLYGSNTDYVGVLRALERRMRLRGRRVVIYGAGGSARAAAFALTQAGAEVFICARRPDAGRKLAKAAGGEAIKRSALRSQEFDALLNATPIGMFPLEKVSPLAASELNCTLVMDLIYRPIRTKLLRLAASRKIACVSGAEMFLAQGFAQWEHWMGSKAPESIMRNAVLRTLKNEENTRW